MPSKRIKFNSGRVLVIKSILLPNGNLVHPQRMEHDRTLTEWVEVSPGENSHKRWLPVSEPGSDPREDPEYQSKLAKVKTTPEYIKFHQK
jgi:hypothetical protein